MNKPSNNFTNRLMENDNYYITNALNRWHVNDKTYCMIKNQGQGDEYLVRVLPDNENIESYWLANGQTWETEAGVAWSILNYVNDFS